MVALVITIIIIIVLAAIVMFSSSGTIDSATYAKFAHEISEVQTNTEAKRAKNVAQRPGEVYENEGFTKVFVENAPESFVSFSTGEITGYWIDLDYIEIKDIKTGREQLITDQVRFGKEDVYIYDAEGKVYYVKGYPDDKGRVHYKLDEIAPETESQRNPIISRADYALSADKTTAIVTVVAEAAYGGELTVTGGGTTARKIGENTYELTIDRNGTIMVTAREKDAGTTTRILTIEGIVKKADTTAPVISGLTSSISGSNVIIQGSATDVESKIVGYKFTMSEVEPTSWSNVSSNSISPSYTTATSGTYYFWVKNEEGLVSHKSISVTAPVIKNQYTISYNANGGTGAPASQTKTEGDALTLSTTKPTRSGYTFLGWSTAATATIPMYQAGDSYTTDGDVTLYAIWEGNTYTVQYDVNGGIATSSPFSQTKIHGQALILSSKIPTRSGHTFQGWGTSSTATTAMYQPGDSYTTDGDIVLYAVWKAITYTVSYHANGGNGAPASQIKTDGTDLILSSAIPTRTGYTFQGWGVISNATTATYQPGGKYITESDITLYAVWKVITYTIQYDANGGAATSIPGSQTKTYGQTVTLSATKPTREGYTFQGWATASNATTVEYQAGGSYTTDADVILYAVWKEDIYTISYNANGGTTSTAPASQTKTYGTELILSSKKPTYRRRTFMGWATTKERANAGTVDYVLGDTYTENSSVTLYAVWKSSLIPSIANSPRLGDGMVAVYWNDANATTELTSDYYTSSMYSYTMGDGINDTQDAKWANAKTEDGSYWVWIPRFAYKLTYYTNTNRNVEAEGKTAYGDVDVLFLDGTSDTYYRDKNGDAQPLPEGYIVHPAFQKMKTTEDLTTNPLGKWDSELEGIWVAKYEASREDSTDGGVTWLPTTESFGGGNFGTRNTGTDQIRIVSKPSVKSWRNIKQTTIYANCETMYPQLASHQMKNSEWGAVAYLTYSPYGRNGKELAVNQCYDAYTGAGKGIGTSSIFNSTYGYSEETTYDGSGNVINYAFDETYAWNTDLGRITSTTGNIYGVYDISGGVYEYVASYLMNGHSNLSLYGSNLVNSMNLRNKQIYSSTVTDGSNAQEADYTLCKNKIYGDSVYEISAKHSAANAWCQDYSNFPNGSGVFFRRGGYYNGGSASGAFTYGSYSGKEESSCGFRPVLCVEIPDK